MRRGRLPGLLLALFCAATQAQEAPPLVGPDRLGYAFDQPRILAQQRLFGIAHGVSLLAATCLKRDENATSTQAAFLEWQTKQNESFGTAFRELADYYFGPRAPEANWLHVVRTLRLKEVLDFAEDSDAFKEACRTLPEALMRPRYDLAAQFLLERDLARLAAGTEVEQRIAMCQAKLAATAQERLGAAATRWREANIKVLEEARAALAERWQPEGKDDPTLEQWLEKLRRKVNQAAATEPCVGFADWIETPAAHIDRAFAAPPPKEQR